MGLNHGGSLETALALVDCAADAGASAVKLQTLRSDELVAASCPAPAHVQASSLSAFFEAFELDEAGHRAVADRAHARGLAFISTPLYDDAVALLERVGCDAYKIASGDLTHHRLIAKAAATGKPLILSTGMSESGEVAAAIHLARSAGARDLALLHCVSAYPTPHAEQNLAAIRTLARRFDEVVGLSDHSMFALAPVMAVALGAAIYERHFVLDAAHDAIDKAVSMTPDDLRDLVTIAARAREALGSGERVCGPAELANRTASRRALYARRTIVEGERIAGDDIIALRPATGLDASRWADLVGATASRTIPRGTAFEEHDVRTGARGQRGAA